MGLFLGIDGGGSGTEACLGDERGRILAKAEAGPSNPIKVGIEQAKKQLARAAHQVLLSTTAACDHHKPLLVAVCAGVSGAGQPAVARALGVWLRRAIPARHHLLVTDAEIALHAAVGTDAGMIVISGTGSIAHARGPSGKTLRAGGWGPSFDDLGSGYDLGRKAIMAALQEFDGRGGHTVLTKRICRALQLTDITQVARKKLDPQEVAAIFLLVSDAADEGDRVARRLCREAAGDLAQLVLALHKRLGRHPTIPVVCAGGIFRSSPTIRRQFARYVHQDIPSAQVRLLQREPVEGALAMARTLATSGGNTD